MNSSNIQVIPKTRYKYINPWTAPIPNDYLGIHIHRWPTNRNTAQDDWRAGSALQQNPAITNYDWWRTTDGPFGYQWSLHFQVESLKRVGTTVTVRIYFPPEAENNSSTLSYFTDGDKITISGANETGFNGEFSITRVGGSKTDAYGNVTVFTDLQYTSPISGNTTATTSTYLNCFNWTMPDAAYNQVSIVDNKKILYTFLGVPNWIAKEPYGSRPYGGTMSASFPSAAMYPRYIEFCQALASRYPNITHFEVGNEPGTGAWEPFYNPTLVVGDAYSIKINSYSEFSGGFPNVKIGCSVQCTGISKLAKITTITRYPDNDGSVEAKLTFDMPVTGPVSGLLYVSYYYYRTVTGYTPLVKTNGVVTAKTTITLNNVSGLSATTDGQYHHINSVYGTNIKDYTFITAINGNTITIEGPYLGPISGQVRFSAFDGAFFTGSPNELAELTRITKLAIKAVRPDAKIVSAADPRLNIPGLATPNPTTASTGDGILNTFPLIPHLWEASAEGYSYLGDTGAGTRAIDHVDVLATHTYGHREFEGFLQLKNYAASLGYPDMDIWSTEFGEDSIPYVGTNYQNWTDKPETYYSPNWIKSVTTSNIVTFYGATSQIWGAPVGRWLRDIGGNKIGIVLSVNAGTPWPTLTLKDNALKNYSGLGLCFTNKEKQESVLRFWVSPAAAGFKKSFLYDCDNGTTMGILDDSYSSKLIGILANSIKGKTVATVEQLNNHAPIKINFTDGSSLNTGDLLIPKPVSEYINNQINYLLEVNVAGDMTKDLYAVTPSVLTVTSMERNLHNLLREVSLTAFSHPTDSAAPWCVAISPRHVIASNSFHPIINSTVVFKDRVIGEYAYNKVYTKTITKGTNIVGTDIWIGYLDSDLPASIIPILLLPSNFMNYMTTETSEVGLPVYIAEQNKSLSIANWSKYDNALLNDAITIPSNFLGVHFHRWPATDGVFGTIFATSGSTTTLVGDGGFVLQLGSGIYARGTKLYNSTTKTLIGTVDQVIDATHLLVYDAVTLLSNTGYNFIIATPNAAFDYSMVRTHDGYGSTWNHIQPSRGVWNWDLFDIVYNTHTANGKQILFTIFGTPLWAAARPYELISAYGGTAAEPEDMDDYVNFLSAVALRYPLIKHYEVWNEAEFTYYTATGRKGDYTVSLTGTTNGIKSGVIVSGDGIAVGAKVVYADLRSFVVTLDKPNTSDVNGAIQFQQGFTRICSAVAGTNTITIDSPILTADDQYWDEALGTTNAGARGIYIWNTDSITPFKNQIQSANGNTITTTEPIASNISNVTLFFGGARFFSGTAEKLAEMTRLASQAIKAVRPDAKIVSSPPGGVDILRIKSLLNTSAEGFVYNGISGAGTTCKDWVDIIGTHTYGNYSPTNIIKLRKTLNSMGIPPNVEIWDTEVGDFTSKKKNTTDAIKEISLLMFAAAFGGCSRVFFYSYDHYDMGLIRDPIVVETVGANLNFIKGKTLKTLNYEEPDGGANKGSMTATFTDNTTITI